MRSSRERGATMQQCSQAPQGAAPLSGKARMYETFLPLQAATEQPSCCLGDRRGPSTGSKADLSVKVKRSGDAIEE